MTRSQLHTVNTAFFRPETNFGGPRAGAVRSARLLNPETNYEQVGLLLGSMTRAVAVKKGKPVYVNAYIARPNARVLWASQDARPEIVKEGGDYFIKSGSVLSFKTEKGGHKKVIVEYVGDGKCLVHLQTGMFGRPDMNAFIDHVKKGGLYPHGSFALEPDAATNVETQESSDTEAEHAPQHEIATRVAWRVGKNIEGMEFPFRREDVWEVPVGASILVSGIYENELCRLVNEHGVMKKVDAPDNGRNLFMDHEEKRREKNAAARQQRLERKAARETGQPTRESTVAEAEAPAPVSPDETIQV